MKNLFHRTDWTGHRKVAGLVVLLILCFGRADAWGQSGDVQEANQLDQQSVQLYQQGNYTAAARLAEQALAIRERVLGPEHPDTAHSLNNLAAVYEHMGEYAKALLLCQRALAITEKALGPEHPATARSLNNLAEVYREMGDYAKALLLYQRALAIREKALGPEHLDTAQSLNNLAWVYQDMGDYAKALLLYQRALTIREKAQGPEHPDTAQSLNNLAVLYWFMGDYEETLQFFQRGLAVEDRAFADVFTIASERQKLLFAEKSQEYYLAALSLIHHHFRRDTAAVRWGLELVLRRKGIVLDVQARTQEALAAHLTGEPRQSWQRLTQHRSTLARLFLSGPGKQSPAEYKQAVEELYAALSREEEFLAQHSGLVAQELAQRKVTAKMLAERLPRDGALAEFVRIRDWDEEKKKWSDAYRYFAFVLTPDDWVTLVDLGEAKKIDTNISEALEAINDPDFRKDLKAYTHRTDTKLSELYGLLLQPLEAALGSHRRLIVSSDGEINKVPFAALRTPDGHYLVEKLTLSYVASGRDLLRGESGVSPTVDLMLAANPAFDDRQALHTATVSGDAVRAGDYGEHFDPLPGTAAEARMLPPLLAGTQQILQGREATESAVRSAKSPKVLHLATHGFFLKNEGASPPDALPLSGVLDNDLERGKGGIKTLTSGKPSVLQPPINPLVRSGLALAGANHAKEITTGDDGILTALEVSGMNLYGTDLVILSACETGLGDVQVGEGVYGLRRAFVLAGARNLVMSLWATNDKVTLDQMAEFYRGYAQGQSPAEALREAQLQSIASLREQTKATVGEPLAPVRLWAPFIVQQTGEGRGSRPLMVRTATYGWWNLFVPLAAMVGLLALSRVRLNEVPAEGAGTTTPFVKTVQQPATYARLVRQSPSDSLPQEIAFIHDEILIGSKADCDVILRHPSIAHRHARVQWRKQGYVLCDLQSPTGTYVNGRRISENLLKDGWTVCFGEVEFVFYDARP